MALFSILFRYRDKKSPDKLGLYPEKFHISAFPERRYLWTSRALVIFAVLNFCINIILTSVLFLLLPQRSATPSLYQSDNTSYQLKDVQPASFSTTYKDLLTEKYITEYIIMRHAVPKSTADLYYRWDTSSKFYWYSGIRNYYDFINKIDNYQIKNFIKMKMKRTIDIDFVKKLNSKLWMAQFRTTTTTKDIPEENVIIWRAYLTISYLEFDKYGDTENEEREKQNYTTNPFGFKVMKYSLAYAGKPEKSYTAQQSAKLSFEKLEDIVK